jgi:hypothetical protein
MEMTEQQSLQIIQRMILEAKRTLKDDGSLYLLWGWAVLLSAVAHFALLEFSDFGHPYVVWGSMPIVGIVYGFLISKKARATQVATYIHEFMLFQWGGFIITLVILFGFMPQMGFENGYPVVILLIGLSHFVSGGVLKFKPLIFGAALCWPIAIVAFLSPFKYQLLLLGLAVIFSNILPGYWLRSNFKE